MYSQPRSAGGGQPRPASHRRAPSGEFVHILVGDAVSANETAAKLLLRVFATRPLVDGGRYLLLLVKCGTHQAALAAVSVGGFLWATVFPMNRFYLPHPKTAINMFSRFPNAGDINSRHAFETKQNILKGMGL